jgi:hypothetical protein
MKLNRLLILLIWLFASCQQAHAQRSESPRLTDRETSLLFGELKEVRVFGIIAVSLVGDADKIGLDEDDLTNQAKTCFKKYFGEKKLEDISKDSEKFLKLVSSRDKTIGNITFRVWVIGDGYPVAYHVRCEAGNFSNPSIWTDEVLGHGSRETTPRAIRDILDEMMKVLSAAFLKIHGQSM